MLKILLRGAAVLVLDDAGDGVHAVVNEGEGAALFAAVHELDGPAVDDVVEELGDDARGAFLRLVDVVELGADEVERAEERVVEPGGFAVGVDDAVEELLDAGINPALLGNRAEDEVAGVFVELLVRAHAVELGGGGEDEALLVFHALADDFHVGLEIQLVDADGVLDVERGRGDGDEGHDGVALADVVFDPLLVDGDVALEELEARVVEAVLELRRRRCPCRYTSQSVVLRMCQVRLLPMKPLTPRMRTRWGIDKAGAGVLWLLMLGPWCKCSGGRAQALEMERPVGVAQIPGRSRFWIWSSRSACSFWRSWRLFIKSRSCARSVTSLSSLVLSARESVSSDLPMDSPRE